MYRVWFDSPEILSRYCLLYQFRLVLGAFIKQEIKISTVIKRNKMIINFVGIYVIAEWVELQHREDIKLINFFRMNYFVLVMSAYRIINI